jgi:hypothetical protein
MNTNFRSIPLCKLGAGSAKRCRQTDYVLPIPLQGNTFTFLDEQVDMVLSIWHHILFPEPTLRLVHAIAEI